MKFNKFKFGKKAFMNEPSKKVSAKSFMNEPSKKVSAKPKPKPKRWGDDGYISPSNRMKNKWIGIKQNETIVNNVTKSGDMADTVRPTGMRGTAYTEADMAKRSAIRMKQNLKTAAKIGGGAVLGAGAAYGASKFKTAPSRDLEKELVDQIKTSRGEKPSSSMNDVDFNRSKWSQHKKSQRGY